MPETYEEPAWVGTRWRVRTRTFAHLLVVEDGWPKAYSRAAGTDGPATVPTSGPPGPSWRRCGVPGSVFPTPWRDDEVGLVLDGSGDWAEVSELLAESYRVLAPAYLSTMLDAG